MKLVLVAVLLLIPAVVGAAAAGAAAVREATAAPLFAWVPAGGYEDPFPFGECTWWAAYNRRVSWNGDAREWLTNAARQGVATTSVPSVGAIAVYKGGGEYSELGHVAVVVAVTPTAYAVSEMNAAAGPGRVSTRVIPWPDPAVEGFIPLSEGEMHPRATLAATR
ncbi:MAG: CHAP domain-containing protein [Chloroflexota bacterium]|nr:CHAP domain-containing protein [Chloroflexota bacterium]